MSDESGNIQTETGTGDEGAVDASTVLTGDEGAVDAGTPGDNSEAVTAAQAIIDADDPNVSAEDKAAAQAIVDAAADDAGSGSDTSVPDTYADFVMPEGIELDETALASASPLFKELELTQDQAQKVVDLYAKQVQASSLSQVEAFNQLKSDWREQSQNDKEFGGDKFDENVKVAQLAVTKYGTPELKQLLEDHGVGNNPEVIRFMVRVGRTLGEDVPGSSGSAPSVVNDRVTTLYGKQNES